MGMQDHGTSVPVPVDDRSRREVLEVLRDARGWTATTGWWGEVDAVLTRLQDTWAAGDGAAFRRATADLEILSEKRATDAGDVDADSKTLPPLPVRDRLNDTIHKIGAK